MSSVTKAHRQQRRHPPARFVGAHRGAAADGGAQRFVAGLSSPRRPMQGAHQAAGRDLQRETFPEQRRDLPERQPELLVEHGRERHRLWADLASRSAQRVRRLQRMASLDPPLTAGAMPDVYLEAADDRADRRDVFLVLGGDPVPLQSCTAVGTAVRQRRLVGLVDARRNRAAALTTVAAPRLAARSLRLLLPRAARERRRLPLRRAARRVELLAQPRVFLLQVVALATHAIEVALQSVPSLLRAPQLALRALQLVRDRVLALAHASRYDRTCGKVQVPFCDARDRIMIPPCNQIRLDIMTSVEWGG